MGFYEESVGSGGDAGRNGGNCPAKGLCGAAAPRYQAQLIAGVSVGNIMHLYRSNQYQSKHEKLSRGSCFYAMITNE